MGVRDQALCRGGSSPLQRVSGVQAFSFFSSNV